MKAATANAIIQALIDDLFQSTPPVKAATNIKFRCSVTLDISIHAARECGDGVAVKAEGFCDDISIHAAREGGDGHKSLRTNGICRISIHAAREGGDAIAILPSATSSISIHAAREGGDGRMRWRSR